MLVEIFQERDEPFLPGLIYTSTFLYAAVVDESGRKQGGGSPNRQLAGGNDDETSGHPVDDGNEDVSHASAAQALNPSGEGGALAKPQDDDDDDEPDGARLGLGDFIFYSVLVGRAMVDSGMDYNTTMACFISILVGLGFTLSLLAIWKKALPALPFSLTFGMIFYFGTSLVIKHFCASLAAQQIYI